MSAPRLPRPDGAALPSSQRSDVVTLLRTTLQADAVLDDPDVIASYSVDQSQLTTSSPALAVVVARSTEDVSALLRLAHEQGFSVVARGAGTGLSGGANGVQDCVILSLHRLGALLGIDRVNRTAVVQPGLVTRALRTAAADVGLYYPPDPGSIDACTIGGNIATNAGGMCCVKYGVTGDFVLGLQVVLAGGRVIRTGTRTVKGVAGYDMTSLFVGSEGTLGVVTEATLRLLPSPAPPVTLVASFATTEQAGACVSAIVESGAVPSLMELLDRTTVEAVDRRARMEIGSDVGALLLLQSDAADAAQRMPGFAEICAASGAVDVATTADPAEGAAMLEARRLALPALESLGDCLLDDVCVPRSRIADLISAVEQIAASVGLMIGVFGHAGDGNFHPTVIFDGKDPDSTAAARAAFDAITRTALELGGTITGEHGVGLLKTAWLVEELGPEGIDLQRSIKKALDPRGVLNPGKVFNQ
jgi:glycolate oxidase